MVWNPFIFSILLIGLAVSQGLWCWAHGIKWIGLALILIFVGGIMVIFIYVSTLSSGGKVFMPWDWTQRLILGGLMLFFCHPIWTQANYHIDTPSALIINSRGLSLIFLLSYLLFLLFVIVKLVQSFKGSLIEKF